jgi:transposase-like protein
MGLAEALAECDTCVSEDKIPWSKIAEKHGVVRSTLTRTWRGETRPHQEKVLTQQKLTPQQEEELVKYIEQLTARHIPPTREMIANFASAVAKESVSESWVTRFINKYTIHLISQYSTGMNSNRHNADSYVKYELYFNLLQRKIAEYNVDAEHTYNMDEKGFIIGVTSRTKHVFSRRMWEKKEVKASL